MTHLVLIGDSVLDNVSYTAGGPAVIEQVTSVLPNGWHATLCARDGSTTEDVREHIGAVPQDASHLLISVGGNNALLRSDLLDTPVSSTAEALLLLHEAAGDFETSYRSMLREYGALGKPLAICTIYHGNFPDEEYRKRVATALAVFNDVIIRAAIDFRLPVLDLRTICNRAEDFANPIEPSSHGGAKIASAIVKLMMAPAIAWPGALIDSGQGMAAV